MSKRVFFLFLSDLLPSACTLFYCWSWFVRFCVVCAYFPYDYYYDCTCCSAPFCEGSHSHTPDDRRFEGGNSRLCFLVYNCADRSGLPETRAGIRTRIRSGRIHPSRLVCLFSPVTSSAAFLRKIAARCTTASLVAFLGTLVRGTSRRGAWGDTRCSSFWPG